MSMWSVKKYKKMLRRGYGELSPRRLATQDSAFEAAISGWPQKGDAGFERGSVGANE